MESSFSQPQSGEISVAPSRKRGVNKENTNPAPAVLNIKCKMKNVKLKMEENEDDKQEEFFVIQSDLVNQILSKDEKVQRRFLHIGRDNELRFR